MPQPKHSDPPNLVLRLIAFAVVCFASLACASVASAHSCGSNYCSGSDSNTGSNVQGNGPQIYIGEVGTYGDDFYGASGVAWNSSAAASAVSRDQNGTGIGVADYYFGGGAGADNQNMSDYCFGALQGFWETWYMAHNYSSSLPYQYLSFLDVEPGNNPVTNNGWSTTETAADQQVFNGWSDFVAGRSTGCNFGSNNTWDLSQYGIYSAPGWWNYVMPSGISIPNTFEWTYENEEDQCSGLYFPGSNWGSLATWFNGGSNYHWGLQFANSATDCGGPDYDEAYEPMYMPVLGANLGN